MAHSQTLHSIPFHSIPRESQFLGRLIRSAGIPRERGVWNFQGGGKDKHFFFFFPLRSLFLVTKNVFMFKPGTDDYTTNNSVWTLY